MEKSKNIVLMAFKQALEKVFGIAPDYLIQDGLSELGNQGTDERFFNKRLFAYDLFNDTTGLGFNNINEFVRTIVADFLPTNIQFQLRPTVTLPSPVLLAKKLGSQTQFNRDPKDIASYFFPSRTLSFLVKTDIDLNNRMICFAEKSIYGFDGESFQSEIKNIRFYFLDKFDPIFQLDGSFKEGILNLKEIKPIEAQKDIEIRLSDGSDTMIKQGIDIQFFRFQVQALKMKRKRFTFTSPPILWKAEFRGNTGNISAPYTIPKSQLDNWHENLFAWIREFNAVKFLPLWTQEQSWWDKNKIDRAPIYTIDGIGEAPTNDQELKNSTSNGILDLRAQPDNINGTFPVKSYLGNIGIFADVGIASGPTTEDFAKLIADGMNYTLPSGYSVFGIERLDQEGSNFGGTTLPRTVVNNPASPWIQRKNETLYLNDLFAAEDANIPFTTLLTSEFSLSIKNDVQFTYDNGSLEPYEPYFPSETRVANKINILFGTLLWMGVLWNSTPPQILNNSLDIDLAEDPDTWAPAELNKTLGLFPFPIESNFWNNQSLSKVSTPTFTLEYNTSALTKAFVTFNSYRSDEFKKIEVSSSTFFNQDGNTYTIDFDFIDVVEVETFWELTYYGGYEYTVENFENSFEDAQENGDIPCKINILGFEVEQSPQTYTAENRTGNPLSTTTSKVFGTTELSNTLKNIKDNLSKYNMTKTQEGINEEYLYDINKFVRMYENIQDKKTKKKFRKNLKNVIMK